MLKIHLRDKIVLTLHYTYEKRVHARLLMLYLYIIDKLIRSRYIPKPRFYSNGVVLDNYSLLIQGMIRAEFIDMDNSYYLQLKKRGKRRIQELLTDKRYSADVKTIQGIMYNLRKKTVEELLAYAQSL